jgi:hypothetical protein
MHNNNVKDLKVKAKLPAGPVSAIQHLIRISQQLLLVAEKETQALLFKDLLAFSILQYEKEKLAHEYAAASEEFRARIEEFRNLDKSFINRLERLQRELGEKATSNNVLVNQIYQIAQQKTEEGLAKAAEFGRAKTARFAKTMPANEGATS